MSAEVDFGVAGHFRLEQSLSVVDTGGDEHRASQDGLPRVAGGRRDGDDLRVSQAAILADVAK